MFIVHDHSFKNRVELAPGNCLIELHCTGVCYTNLHVAYADWPLKATTPLIASHEVIGEIVAIGDHTAINPVNTGARGFVLTTNMAARDGTEVRFIRVLCWPDL